MPPPSPSTQAPAAALTLAQRLQQLQTECGGAYDAHAPTASPDGATAEATKKADAHENSHLQRVASEHLGTLYAECFSASTAVRLSAPEFELLLRLLPSLTALASAPTLRPPLLMIIIRVLHQRKNDGPLPHVSDTVLEGVLLSLVRLLHHPESWAAGSTARSDAIRATAAGLLARLLRFFVAGAAEAAVEAGWRQWQEVAHNALLSELQAWVVAAADAQRTPPSSKEAHKRPPPAGLAASAECLLCHLLDLLDALTEHPCARTLSSDAWPPVLASIVPLAGAAKTAPQHLEMVYAVLQVLTHAREKGVVSPGVWRQLAVKVVEASFPRGISDCPSPVPVSSLSSSSVSYATLFLKYVHLTKSLLFVTVEESSTDSSTARDSAAKLHAALAGLVEASACVMIEKGQPVNATQPPVAGGRVSLLAAVVKDLLSVRQESRNAPRQYARYVEGMLAGPAPLVPYMVQVMVSECHNQVSQLAAPDVATVLATNMEILQGVFLWSVHAVVDEGLLDSTRRAAVAAALPFALYDAMDALLGQLHERLATVLLSNPSVSAKKDVSLLAVRVIACEGLALLLHFVLFVVTLYGITDEVSWNARFRDRLYAADTRVMRTVGAFDCGTPQVLRDFTEALDRVSATLGPTAAKVSALLPQLSRPSLVSAGCHGALDKLLEVIPIF